jgi:MYXO-CTERM domain-containing protein
MLKDINRTSTFVADGSILFGVNIVGTGAEIVRNNAVSEPGTLPILALSLLGLAALRGRSRRLA